MLLWLFLPQQWKGWEVVCKPCKALPSLSADFTSRISEHLMVFQREENKSLYVSGRSPEKECDTEKLCPIVKHSGTGTSLLGQHIHTTQQFPRVPYSVAAC